MGRVDQARAARRAGTTVSITCVRDGRAHAVPDAELATPVRGRYRALCGHEVTAAALVAPDGRPCPSCAEC